MCTSKAKQDSCVIHLLADGDALGSTLGAIEGILVGAELGVSLGVEEGALVGESVGDEEGTLVGDEVGADGQSVAHNSTCWMAEFSPGMPPSNTEVLPIA